MVYDKHADITIVMTGAEARAVIDAADLRGLNPTIDRAPRGVLKIIMALENAQTLGGNS